MGTKIKMTLLALVCWRGGEEVKTMMLATCDEVGCGGGGRRAGGGCVEGIGCPWRQPRYNLICGSRKQ